MNSQDTQPRTSPSSVRSASVIENEQFIRALMSGIVSSAMDAIITVDTEQRILLFNAAAEQMFRCSADTVIGEPLDRFIPERFRQAHHEHIQHFGQTQTTHRRMGELGVISGVRADGEEFPIEASISQIEVEGQKFFTVILRDITRRKNNEAKLYEQAALLDHARDAIIVRDLADHILFWNSSAERIYGWTAQEAIGRDKRELLYPAGSPQYDEACRIVIDRGEWRGELRQTAKDGHEIIAECRWTLVRDEAGQPRSILSINTDITERKNMEMQFLRAQRLESIGALAGGIAHDLNNVLAPILMAVPVLEREATDDNSRRKLEIIRRNAKLGGEIIRQLLSFARGGTGEQTALQPGKRIRQICQMLQRTMPKSIEVEISTPDDLWEVTGDATQFDQMLMNLCVNARDAMPRGGHLMISAENAIIDAGFARQHTDARPGPHVQIIVADTGTGIPPEIREKIFEPFFTTKEMDQGTGLGLATVLKIIKSHGGFIDVYSEAERGATFNLYLPARASAETVAAEESKPELPAGHNELILVVDDEATIREIAKDTLTAFGYRVMTASDGAEAIALLAGHNAEIKAVLLDQMMPHLDGPSAIRALRHLDPHVRIIAMSGLPESTQRAADTDDAVKATLLKPYTAMQLLQTLAEVLHRN